MTNDEILTKLCKFDQFGPAKIQRICKWGNTRAIAKIIDYNNNLAASTNTNENTIQAVLVINTSERLIENEDDLTE